MKKPSSRRSVPFAQAVALTILGASVGVLLTAVACASFAVGPSFNVGDFNSIVSVETTRSTSIHTRRRGGLIQASSDSWKHEHHSSAPSTTQEKQGPWPKVAWLMSYPNSGTSYTLHLTRQASNSTTATNYALEGEIRDEPSVPVHVDETRGPFLELIRGINTTVPSKFILTKTHCGGFCSNCNARHYIETPRSFEIACRSGKRAFLDEVGKLTTEFVTYDQSTVGKAIHVFRHPLDNVVARFHLKYYEYKELRLNERDDKLSTMTNSEWLRRYPNNRTGFAAWCKGHDSQSGLGKLRWVDGHLAALLREIPCHQEFYKYVQWHNLAFDVTRGNNIPVFVVHYHNYSQNFEGTLSQLLDFLELPRQGVTEPFHAGKEYHSFYTKEQRLAIRRFLEEFSSSETWDNLKDYKF